MRWLILLGLIAISMLFIYLEFWQGVAVSVLVLYFYTAYEIGDPNA